MKNKRDGYHSNRREFGNNQLDRTEFGNNRLDKVQWKQEVKKERRKTKMTRQITCLAIIFWMLSFATVGATPLVDEEKGVGDFKDLSAAHWAYKTVGKMQGTGIIDGYPDQCFRPEKLVTYGEYIKMAMVILGQQKSEGESVGGNGVKKKAEDGKHWAQNDYSKGLTNKLYTAYDIPDVKLAWQMTRGDMALILNGLLANRVGEGQFDIRQHGEDQFDRGQFDRDQFEREQFEDYDQLASKITDVNHQTSHEYEIVKGYGRGILKGYPDGTFRPEGKLTRAEAATSLYRVIEMSGKPSTEMKPEISDKISTEMKPDMPVNMGEFWKEDWMEGWQESEQHKLISAETAGLTIRVPWNGRLAGFDHTMVGFIYLIKGGHIVEYCRSIPAETFITSGAHYQLETIDYIMCIPSKHGIQKNILLVKNPFREQV